MSDKQMSDLAKAILAGDRIPPSSNVSLNGDSVPAIPKGATPITEGAQTICAERQPVPQGAKTVNFTKDDEK